ncbi:MAG: metal ABC transporter permease [Bacteroidetes bacterium]|nr:MAG: metal ABC transporter permease [Bacteroidota bacterium]
MDMMLVLLAGCLVAVSNALLGCWLVLRKNVLVGDAIAHAVLPGIVLAYWITQSRGSGYMLIGAAVLGMFITWLIETLQRKASMQQDASIGLSFTFLFAVGVIMVSWLGDKVDLDQECVLYGDLAYIPLDTRPLWQLVGLFVGVCVFLYVGHRGLWLTTFDENYSASIGISTVFWHYSLMSAVSFSTVFSFEAVGAVLVVAFLVVPPATAYLLTESLPTMLFFSVIFAIIAVFVGYAVAVALNTSLAGTMATVVGAEFFLAFAYTRLKTAYYTV